MGNSKPRGYFYEQLEINTEIVSQSRTISESDVTLFTGYTGDYNPLYCDETFCKKYTPDGRRVVPDVLALSIFEGLSNRVGLFEGTGLASLQWTWRTKKSLFAGDTVHAVSKIIMKRETKKPGRGIVNEFVELFNQHGELVAEGEHLNMIQMEK